MRSQYLGLWKSERSGWYLSQPIKKKDIDNIRKEMGRIAMRHNKYHDPKKNTPRFVFAFVDANSEENITMKFETDWYEEIIEAMKRIHELAYSRGEGMDSDVYGEIQDISGEILKEYENR